MARPRGEGFDRQRAAIRAQAARLFAEDGFARASMAAIAAACGVSKPLLYHYYRDKAALLFDVADSYVQRLLAIVAEVTAEPLEPEARLRELVRRFMAEYEHARHQHQVLVQDVKFLAEAERRQVAARQREVVDAFAAAIAAARPRRNEASLRVPLAMILFGMINWTFTWLRAGGPLTYAHMADLVADLFLHGALPPAGQAAGPGEAE